MVQPQLFPKNRLRISSLKQRNLLITKYGWKAKKRNNLACDAHISPYGGFHHATLRLYQIKKNPRYCNTRDSRKQTNQRHQQSAIGWLIKYTILWPQNQRKDDVLWNYRIIMVLSANYQENAAGPTSWGSQKRAAVLPLSGMPQAGKKGLPCWQHTMPTRGT